jgi:hypothetical protein
MPGVHGRYTLDVAHLVGTSVIRRHLVCLTMYRCQDLEIAERLNPGPVYTERSRYVPGDQSWTIEYPNRELAEWAA